MSRTTTNELTNVQSSSRNEHVLKRVDLELFLRFLTAISETTAIGITGLQMKTGTNHTVCTKYVTLMEKFELAKLDVQENSKQIQITERGRHALLIISSYFQ